MEHIVLAPLTIKEYQTHKRSACVHTDVCT